MEDNSTNSRIQGNTTFKLHSLVQNRIKEGTDNKREREARMPLYRIGQDTTKPSPVVILSCFLLPRSSPVRSGQTVVQPSLAINSSTVIKPVKCRQILVYATLPARFFAANTRKEGNHLSRWCMYSR